MERNPRRHCQLTDATAVEEYLADVNILALVSAVWTVHRHNHNFGVFQIHSLAYLGLSVHLTGGMLVDAHILPCRDRFALHFVRVGLRLQLGIEKAPRVCLLHRSPWPGR